MVGIRISVEAIVRWANLISMYIEEDISMHYTTSKCMEEVIIKSSIYRRRTAVGPRGRKSEGVQL
jgi:hypothetical protein